VQLLVPTGGTRGAWIGSTDGGASGQTFGGQIGRMSIELVHIGTFSPFVQRQTQSAQASPARIANIKIRCRMSPTPYGQFDQRTLHIAPHSRRPTEFIRISGRGLGKSLSGDSLIQCSRT